MAIADEPRVDSVIITGMNDRTENVSADERLKLAARHIDHGECDAARAQCEAVLAAAPEDVDAMVMLGRVAMLQYRWQDAIALFDRALRDRVDPWTLANLGNCYWKTGDLDQAEY